MQPSSSESLQTPPLLKLLAHDVRWRLLGHLAHSDYRVAELAQLVDEPLNLVSYHLRQFRTYHLVSERRSSADERSIYYSLDLHRFYTLYSGAAAALHPALGLDSPPDERTQWHFGQRQPRLLFLCTGNSSRSPMAAELTRYLSAGAVLAWSAGSHPAEQVNSRAVRALAGWGLDLSSAVPQHVDRFTNENFDRVITLCDRVREVCPPFPGQTVRIHWSFPDPSKVEGTDSERDQAFTELAEQLAGRIRLLLTQLEQEWQRTPRS